MDGAILALVGVGFVTESFLVGIFFLLPVCFATGLVLFFRAFQIHKGKNHRALRLLCGNVLVLFFVLSMVMLWGEVYYRFIYDSTDSFGLTKTTQRWFKRHYQMNENGFRDSEQSYAMQVAEGRSRITFIGDSFTAGHGVADVEARFANRIRAEHSRWEVHVFAQDGWDTGRQLSQFMRSRDYGYELDIVVLVYVLNDISDVVLQWQKTLKRIYGGPDPGFLVKNSYLFNTLYYRFKASRDPDISNYYNFVRSNYKGPAWRQQQTRLLAYRDEVERRGGHFLVVTFPFLHSLGPDNEYLQTHMTLGKYWEELRVPHLDLIDAFDSYAPESLVVNRFDAHPNELAHAIAADSIGVFIEEQMRVIDGKREAATQTE